MVHNRNQRQAVKRMEAFITARMEFLDDYCESLECLLRNGIGDPRDIVADINRTSLDILALYTEVYGDKEEVIS